MSTGHSSTAKDDHKIMHGYLVNAPATCSKYVINKPSANYLHTER